MTEEETNNVENDEVEEEEDAAEDTTEKAENDVDKVKPVIFISAFVCSLFALGVWDLLVNVETNGCSMTYMYEYPKYVRLKMDKDVVDSFPKYGLYAYGEGEGKAVERLEREKFNGIPVLFIPGNSGSYKQVRSLASVALRKAISDSQYKVHFDYFAVDFDEEYSALYGSYLQDQVQFVGRAISKILSLYPSDQGKTGGPQPPSHVVLVGHSLGGIIAKAMLLEPSPVSGQVQVVLTLATPHSPVLQLDRSTNTFYNDLERGWGEAREGNLSHVTLVSVGGGLRDIQVRGGLTLDPHSDLNLLTSHMSSVWVSTDHLCIVWCKQLVLAVNRALFDMIDPVSKQITENSELRKRIVQYQLLQRSGGKQYLEAEAMHPSSLVFDKNGYWSDVVKKQFSFSKSNVTCDNNFMVKLATDDPSKRYLTLDAIKMDADNWVFGCKNTKVQKNTRVCEEGENLSGQSQILPSRGKRKAVHLDLLSLRRKHGYTHIVVHIPAKTEDTSVNLDLYSPRERWVTYSVPKWITFWREFPVIQSTVAGAVFYNVSLQGVEQMWQAYTVKVTPTQCKADRKLQVGLARFVTPWAMDATQVLLGGPQDGNFTNFITAKLQTPRPSGSNDTIESPQVHLYLDPACSYSVTIRASMPQIMGQMARIYTPLLLPCVTAVLVLIVAFQMRRIESDYFCQSPLLTLMASVSPVNVVLPSRLIAYVLVLGPLAGLLPQTDLELLQTRGLDFGILPILMFFISMGLVFLSLGLVWCGVLLFGSLAQKAITRLVTAGMSPGQLLVGEVAVSALARFPALLATLLVALSVSTCGSLALCVGSLAYFLKLFSLYQEYLDGLVKRNVGLRQEDDPSLLLSIYFHLPLSLLYLLSTLLHLPVALAWLQTLPHGSHLPDDHSLPHAVLLSLALAVLWQNEGKPKVDKKFFSLLALSLQAIAVFITCFSMISLYRLSYAISAVFVLLSGHQLLAPDREDSRVEKGVEQEVVEEVEQEVVEKVESEVTETGFVEDGGVSSEIKDDTGNET